ncbi:Cell wall hydrolase [Corynebacterium jeikeium]|nr:hypothetical protein CJEIK_05750 [Corynebacterium jeikeium]SUY81031.1 cell wall hydrolase [Corynebacterium jeikeium]
MTTSIVRQVTSRQSDTRVRVSRHERVAPLRQPRVRKPDWDVVANRSNSNTFSYATAPVRRSISLEKAARISGSNERVFEVGSARTATLRARVDRVVHSPGATVFSLGAMSVLLGLAPVLIP